ncbi:hypothetical protein SAMN05216518_11912 [Bacteroidales bacterium KHT7]|nr:hypothetical protein SAMN05216518_11912 [Bacteroidales bacterium KHT7]
MFFLPIQASRQLISIKKKNKMFIFYESAPESTIPLRDAFGIRSRFYKRLAAYLGILRQLIIYLGRTLDVRTNSDEIVRYKSSAIMNC